MLEYLFYRQPTFLIVWLCSSIFSEWPSMRNMDSYKPKGKGSGDTGHTIASDPIKYYISEVTLDPDPYYSIILDDYSK